jgi:hypothetical protein
VHLPAGADAGNKYPLVMLFHKEYLVRLDYRDDLVDPVKKARRLNNG